MRVNRTKDVVKDFPVEVLKTYYYLVVDRVAKFRAIGCHTERRCLKSYPTILE